MQELAPEAPAFPPGLVFFRAESPSAAGCSLANRPEAAVHQSHGSIDVSVFPHARLE
jgi:hypothetical protein